MVESVVLGEGEWAGKVAGMTESTMVFAEGSVSVTAGVGSSVEASLGEWEGIRDSGAEGASGVSAWQSLVIATVAGVSGESAQAAVSRVSSGVGLWVSVICLGGNWGGVSGNWLDGVLLSDGNGLWNRNWVGNWNGNSVVNWVWLGYLK